MLRKTSFLGRNIVWYIYFVLIFVPLISFIFFYENLNERLWLSGISAILFSLLMWYFLIHNEKSFQRNYRRKSRWLDKKEGFSPVVIPPSKRKKRTVLKGNCTHCGFNTIYGFSCSYCGQYYCSEHRLPEKHNCKDLTP